MQYYINLLKENNLLKIIDKPCDIDLEIAHISYIEVKKDNLKAIDFYEKNGFKVVSKRENYYNGVDGYLMLKVVK